MKVVSGTTMRQVDAATIAAGLSDQVLMERAGQGATAAIVAFLANFAASHRRRIVVYAGKGNNGGDGYVIARCLSEQGYDVALVASHESSTLTGAAAHHARLLPTTVPILTAYSLSPDCVVIDCLLGTGIAGPARVPVSHLIREINEAGCLVIAIDIASGVNADDGSAAGEAIRADLTVTIGCLKTGLLTGEGAKLRGVLRLVDIGIDPQALGVAESAGEAFTAAEAQALLGRLPHGCHKVTTGCVTVFGGSALYPSAPFLSGEAALRCGAGLVTVAVPTAIPVLPVPRALIVQQRSGPQTHRALAEAERAALTSQDVIAVGPGLTREPEAVGMVQQLLSTEIKLVVDADALVAISADLLPKQAPWVLTPHAGECARLIERLGGSWPEDRRELARELSAQTGAVVVLKGPNTIVAAPDGSVTWNTTGTQALATGGTGDILTGMIAGFWAGGLAAADAARLATFVHGSVAESAICQRAFIADDLLAGLAPALAAISPFA